MSDVAIFAFGGVIFIISTWAVVAFGLSRMHELQREDLDESPRITEVREDGLTEVYMTRALETDGTAGDPLEVVGTGPETKAEQP